MSNHKLRPDMKRLVEIFCAEYQIIWGQKFWIGDQLLQGHTNERAEKEFGELLEFLERKSAVVQLWNLYIVFCLQHFDQQRKRPLPSWLADEGMVWGYLLWMESRPVALNKMDYRRIILPELRPYIDELGLE